MSQGFPSPKTPHRDASQDDDYAIESSPIRAEEITQYNQPSDRTYENKENKPRLKKAKTQLEASGSSGIQWRGLTMKMACQQGNLPVVVTLWGLALSRNVDLMVPDDEGNTPIHYAASADNAEVGDSHHFHSIRLYIAISIFVT